MLKKWPPLVENICLTLFSCEGCFRLSDCKKEVPTGHIKEQFGLSIKCCTDAPLLVECGAAV